VYIQASVISVKSWTYTFSNIQMYIVLV